MLENELKNLVTTRDIVIIDSDNLGTMTRAETISFGLAQRSHCLIKIWDLWMENHKLNIEQQKIIAAAWKAGTVDLIVDRNKLCQILGIP